MARELFLVAQAGGVPTFIFRTLAEADAVLSAEFWELPTGEYRSVDGLWTGRFASGDEIGRLLGWVPERLVAA